MEQSVCVPSETGRQHWAPPTEHMENTVRVQAAAAHVPDALHVCPPAQVPQDRPQSGSGPQVRPPQEGVHPAETHVPKLHARPLEHDPQELP